MVDKINKLYDRIALGNASSCTVQQTKSLNLKKYHFFCEFLTKMKIDSDRTGYESEVYHS